ALESLPLNEAVLMLRAEIVIVIGGDENALAIAVIEDGDGLGSREVCGVRVLYGARIDILRIGQPRTDHAELENAELEDCESRRGSQKSAEMPRRVRGGLNLDVVDFTKEATAGQSSDSQIVGRVAEREIYGCDEAFGAADVANYACLREGLSHGLLD